jgi:NAD(P)-dependent dehydrogenase (short-subunit alcohol dehydrogenase family)
LKDKVALVTGANAGLGYETTLGLARQGAHVVLACRSPERAQKAREQLLQQVPGAKETILPLDLADPESIRAFGPLVGERVGQVDLLIHNAGVFGVPLTRTPAGYEMHFATNYLGPFALTAGLFPFLRDAPGTRIVCVGSHSHLLAKLRLERLHWESGYNKWMAYGLSKLALLAFGMELNRRLRKRGSSIVVVGAHPGFAQTEGASAWSGTANTSRLRQWFVKTVTPHIPTATDAARPILHAATVEGLLGGEYFGPGGFLEIGGPPGKARINGQVHDAVLGAQLWRESERLTGVRFLSDEVAGPAFQQADSAR